jgi:hypothetical protein
MPKAKHTSVYDPDKPLNQGICNLDHFEYATKCMDFLDSFKDLRLWDARCHGKEPYPYTCWYVSFKNADKERLCIILHFDILPDDIRVYFRFVSYAPQKMLTGWHYGYGGNCKYVYFKANQDELKEAVKLYLERIKPNFDQNKLSFIRFTPG